MITSGNLISVQFVSCQTISSSLNYFHEMRMRFPKLFRKSFPLRFLLSPAGLGSFGASDQELLGSPASPMPHSSGACPEGSNPVLEESLFQALLQAQPASSKWVCAWKSYISLFRLPSPGEFVCLSGLSMTQSNSVLFLQVKETQMSPGSPLSQDFPSTSCLWTRLAQHCSIQRVGVRIGSGGEPTSTLSSMQGPHSGSRLRKLNRAVRNDSGL